MKEETAQIPKLFIWVVCAVCGLPFLLNLLGMDFSSQGGVPDGVGKVDAMFHTLSGAFTHTLLELRIESLRGDIFGDLSVPG